MFTNWPMVFAIPDQKAERIAKLLCEEIVPLFGVPESLLTDRGANFLSHLVLDVGSLLGIQKLNATADQPECDGMVEWFNCTLKSMLCKRVAQFKAQSDRICLQSCGLIRLRHMKHQVRSHRFCCLAGIAGQQPKLHSYLLKMLPRCLFLTVMKN